MKKTKRFLAVVLCMLLMLTPLAVVAETVWYLWMVKIIILPCIKFGNMTNNFLPLSFCQRLCYTC